MGRARDADRGVGQGRESAGGGILLRLLNRHGLLQVRASSYCITVSLEDNMSIFQVADCGLLTDWSPYYSLNVGGFSGMKVVDDAFSNDGIAFTIGCGSGWWRGDDNGNEWANKDFGVKFCCATLTWILKVWFDLRADLEAEMTSEARCEINFRGCFNLNGIGPSSEGNSSSMIRWNGIPLRSCEMKMRSKGQSDLFKPTGWPSGGETKFVDNRFQVPSHHNFLSATISNWTNTYYFKVETM